MWGSRSNDKKVSVHAPRCLPGLTTSPQLFPDEVLAAISTPLFIAYAAFSVVALVVLAKLSRTRYGDRLVMIDVGICAVAGALQVFSSAAWLLTALKLSKVALLFFRPRHSPASLISSSSIRASQLSLFLLRNPDARFRSFKYWITYPILATLLATALVQVNYINKSLQRFESRVVIPSQFCSFSLSAIIGSAVLYREFDGVRQIPAPPQRSRLTRSLPQVDFKQFMNFLFGCTLSALGRLATFLSLRFC